MMVRPTSFGFNEQTAQTNTFQTKLAVSETTLRQKAAEEFEAMVIALRSHGIRTAVFEDPDCTQAKPDAVFPNNWLSTWTNGHVFLYPMATASRRVERSFSALQTLSQDFKITQVTDLSETEQYGAFLESTGVMIFDHQNKIVYGCVSPRCDASLFTSHALELGYTPVAFHAYDQAGVAIYHTNVLMGVASTTAVVCAEAITDTRERAAVLAALRRTGHQVVTITQAQMAAFCGNVLELQNDEGELFLAMSRTAYQAFSRRQRAVLSQDKTLLPFDISTIETVGGGSVRCMLGEIFLPRHPRA